MTNGTYIYMTNKVGSSSTCKLISPKIDALYDLIFDVCNSYHNSNPYHNFRHAVDVMQSTWYFLNSISSESMSLLLRPIDVLALLMAAIGHDVGHPGVNNGFMASWIEQ